MAGSGSGLVTTEGGVRDKGQEVITEDEFDTEGVQSSEKVYTCMHCEEICEYEGGAQGQGNSIYCDSCETWMHWACEGLSPQDGGVLGN